MKVKKFSFVLVLLLFLFAAAATNALAAQATIRAASFVPSAVVYGGNTLKLESDPIVGVVYWDGETESVRRYMPLKGVLEQMGYIVNFDDAENIIDVITPSGEAPAHVPSLSSIGAFAGGVRGAAYNDYTVKINGTELVFEDDAVISVLRGTEAYPQFFLPMRPVLEALGYSAEWNAQTDTIVIESLL